jgi:hypothetical protein
VDDGVGGLAVRCVAVVIAGLGWWVRYGLGGGKKRVWELNRSCGVLSVAEGVKGFGLKGNGKCGDL